MALPRLARSDFELRDGAVGFGGEIPIDIVIAGNEHQPRIWDVELLEDLGDKGVCGGVLLGASVVRDVARDDEVISSGRRRDLRYGIRF